MKSSYVLITAAKNEAKYIDKTLCSVVNQVIKPMLWVIVNDGSTDETEQLVRMYEKDHSFIKVISKKPENKRHFGAKARAVKEAVNFILSQQIDYAFIGNLDADVSFEEDFYQKLIERMERDPELAIIGGLCYEFNGSEWVNMHWNPDWSIGGATHFFRKEFFLETGGYPELKYGGEDSVLEYVARSKNLKVTAIDGVIFHHHKVRPIHRFRDLPAHYNLGIQDSSIGNSLIYELFKTLGRVKHKPIVLGGITRFLGYAVSELLMNKVMISENYFKSVKNQQWRRLTEKITSSLSSRKSA